MPWQRVSWSHANRAAIDEVDSSFHELCYYCFQDQFCQDLCLLRPWCGCCQWLPVVDSSTTSQAEVPLGRIHAFCWEMGPFICMETLSIQFQV